MVKENPLDIQKHNTETQGERSEEAETREEAGECLERLVTAESGDLPNSQLELRTWNQEQDPSEEQALPWSQALSEADAISWPTHLRSFSSPEEYKLVKRTYQQLQHSGYYWGPLTMEEAHTMLKSAPLGTFLIRDSGQPDVFFTLSYQSSDGPTSVRVMLNQLLFSLYGSNKTFDSLFALLGHYTGPSCKLTAPHRTQRPERLRQMCRRALIHTFGADSIQLLPGLSSRDKDYIYLYPHTI